jgi:hypothetical protein
MHQKFIQRLDQEPHHSSQRFLSFSGSPIGYFVFRKYQAISKFTKIKPHRAIRGADYPDVDKGQANSQMG